MSTYLLANIGTRDVQLDTLTDFPPELVNAKTGHLIPRRAGDYLRQPEQFAHYLTRLRLPMIEKALRFITAKPDDTLRIILFATDQPESVAAHYRDGDTIHFAELIREALFARHKATGLAKKQIEIRSTSSNPGDYDQMHDFYRKYLPGYADRTPAPNPAYLLIAGGTPQMNTMLLLIGTEIFGPAAQPLYVSQDLNTAHKLDTARLLYFQAFQRSLAVVLKAYAYSSALALLTESQDYLKVEIIPLLCAALEYGVVRRNLDLEAAGRAFDATVATTRDLRGTVQAFQREVEDQSEQAKLRETIFLAQIAATTENWADFLNRLHRFSEGTMQLLAERLEVKWSDKLERASYKPTWWEANRTLLASLRLATAQAPDDREAENKAREVNRTNLRTIITALATAPEHEAIRSALVELALIDRPIPLRNDIVHRFTPISRDELVHRAGVSLDELLAAMRRAYQHAFGTVVPDASPYDSLNKLCSDILKGTR